MIKRLMILAGILAGMNALGAQNWYFEKHTGGNPGSLNKEPDDYAAEKGWSVLLQDSTYPGMSKPFSMPFAFSMGGNAVTHFKVSGAGYLTFDTTVVNSSVTPGAIPTGNLPNLSIAAWGLYMTGGNDRVLGKVFGTAPNRQYWVKFSSMSTPGDTVKPGNSFNYYSIVLEESSNRVYIVSQYFGSAVGVYQSPLQSIGVQETGSIGVQVTGSPALKNPAATNGIADNHWYEFKKGIQPTTDVQVQSLGKAFASGRGYVGAGDFTSPSVVIRNYGSAPVTSLRLNFQQGNNPVQVNWQGPVNIPANGMGFMVVTMPFIAGTNPGDVVNVKIWADTVNGTTETITANDTLILRVLTIQKNQSKPAAIVLEKATGAWCGTCPDADLINDSLSRKLGKRLITLAYHNLDAMAGAGDSVNDLYQAIYPGAMYNRQLAPQGYYYLPDSWLSDLSTWQPTSNVMVRVKEAKLDLISRKLDWKVTVAFLTHVFRKDITVGGLVKEDHVRGLGTGWDQTLSSVINNKAGHPLYQKVSTSLPKLLGYYHNDVVWGIPSGVTGQPLPGNAEVLSPGDSVTLSFSYTFPSLNDTVRLPSASQYQPSGTVYSRYKPASMKVVGMAMTPHSGDEMGRTYIQNAAELSVWNVALGNKQPSLTGGLRVYPNPVQGECVLEFNTMSPATVNLQVLSITGVQVLPERVLNTSAGENQVIIPLSQIPAGIYLITLQSTDGSRRQQKVLVTR
ncbi:MAG: T9SS type A sorting domain-containing protein [Bacteroidetes bacterium]|nr:T9SS type A sorting domain-containing protein [Bacteroidota bacterium]